MIYMYAICEATDGSVRLITSLQCVYVFLLSCKRLSVTG